MPDYNHPWPPEQNKNYQVNNLHQAMDRALGHEPVLRTITATSPSDAARYTAFGEVLTASITPTFQLDGLYGLPVKDFEIFEANGGTANTTGTLMQVSSGPTNNPGGYGVIRSRRAVRYRPGQGAMCRFTASFSTPQAGSTQRAGFFTQEQALQIGYDGSDFGILRANGGKAHIHEFTVSVGAGGSETVTVTINDDVVAAPVSGSSIEEDVSEIANALVNDATISAKWIVQHCDDQIILLSTSLGVKSGTFSTTSTGTLVTTNSVQQTGVAQTETWVYQSDFNIDKLDGSKGPFNPSGMDLDHTKLNVYQINFRWLGAGELRFALEDPSSGDIIFFHHIHYSNQNIDVHLDNPSLKVGYVAANLTGSPLPAPVTVKGASMLGAIEGPIVTTELPTATQVVTTTNVSANNLTHLLTIKNATIFYNKINVREISLRSITSAFTQNTQAPVTIYVYYNSPDLSDLFKYSKVDNSSVVLAGTDQFVFTPSNIPIIVLDINGSETFDITNLNLNIPPGQQLSFAVESTSLISRSAIGVNWIED